MIAHPRTSPSTGEWNARPAWLALASVALVVTVWGCGDTTPTEAVVELPLVASAAVLEHAETGGRTFARDMSQELSTTVTGDPDGVGTAVLTLNAGQRTICWSTRASNIALPATASHIHTSPRGISGPIVFPLTPPGADGAADGCADDVDRELILRILRDPAQFYVNVHTTEHPPGAIRAQLR